jgi:serine/threonine protein phosphatase 1
MRTLVIGDIHGCFKSLRLLEQRLAFQEDDHIILLGDLVDRGPQSKHVLDWVLQRRARGAGLTVLRGNHELLMLWALQDRTSTQGWLSDFVGGQATLDSYSVGQLRPTLGVVPESHWQLMEDEHFLYVHAHVDPLLPMSEQTEEQLYWSRIKPQPLHVSGKRLFCGHTSQRDGQPLCLPHGICLDTYAHGGGWLTCVDAHTLRGMQANEKGECRDIQLSWPEV